MTQAAQPSGIRYPDLTVVRAVQQQDSAQEGGNKGTTVFAAEIGTPVTVQVPVPDIIEETFLEIRETETGQIITVIEVLSPTNKRPGLGRQKYERKRLEILSTHTHLVEIDLLRGWKPMPILGDLRLNHYRILVRREEQGNHANLYAFNVQDIIPEFPLPLQEDDEEPVINLNLLLDEIYVEARYDVRINYRQPPMPRLNEEDTKWATEILEKLYHA